MGENRNSELMSFHHQEVMVETGVLIFMVQELS
jgi:hypothetical protein